MNKTPVNQRVSLLHATGMLLVLMVVIPVLRLLHYACGDLRHRTTVEDTNR